MTTKRGGLGKGLGAIFQTNRDEHEPATEISIKDIAPNKYQPRREFDQEALNELAASIRQYGVIQPVIVRKTMAGYELVAGERRWRAAQTVGLESIPAVIREYSEAEMMEIALIENIQRQDLNPIEEALAFRQLIDEFGLTQEEVARKVGRSRSLIANLLRMLNLHPGVQEFVSRGTLSVGQARPLLALENQDMQLEAAQKILEEDLSARDAEELVKRMVKPKKLVPKKDIAKKAYYINEAEDRLKVILGTQVRIKPGKLKSRIEIEYYSADDLERIMEVLSASQMAAATKSKGTLVV